MHEIIYYDKWVLVNAYYYTFWILTEEFNKYKVQ